jgi:transcriptional regulator with XRE-family HTH domain
VTELRQLADQLRELRELAGLTPEQLDDLAGLSRGSVEAYELTQRSASDSVLHDLARALGVPARELLGDSDR